MLNSSGKRIILVRHGETEWNRQQRFQGRSDIPLNLQGKAQARALARALKKESITAIYTSPLERAAATASHIAAFHPAAPLITASGLVEMNLGDFEGMELQQWTAQYSDFQEAWKNKPAELTLPGGESLKEVQLRAVDTLKRIAEPYGPGSTLLVCSHNFVIATLLCFASTTPLNQFRTLRQDTAALNILSMDETGFQVEKVNDRTHLRQLSPL